MNMTVEEEEHCDELGEEEMTPSESSPDKKSPGANDAKVQTQKLSGDGVASTVTKAKFAEKNGAVIAAEAAARRRHLQQQQQQHHQRQQQVWALKQFCSLYL